MGFFGEGVKAGKNLKAGKKDLVFVVKEEVLGEGKAVFEDVVGFFPVADASVEPL